ncbi:MAG: sialidase family protein [Bacteroidia bacterium]|nr:sialidase family protein [Bacteroidia bacterium]
MNRPVLLIAIFCVTLSCDRYPDPEVKLLRNYSFSFQTNQGDRFFAGEWVSDSIRFRAVNNNAPLKDSIKVLFEVAKGGGQATVLSAYTNKDGYAYTGWKLGQGSFEQILRAKAYDLSGNYLNSSDLVAYGFRTNEWDTLQNAMEYNISGMVADTVNRITFIVSGGRLYRQGERYYIWNEVTGQYLSSLRTIYIDRNRAIYITTGNGDLIKSTDHGESWQLCTRPYLQINFYLNVSITRDNFIWVSTYNLPIKYSKDSGQTWNELGSDISTHGIGDVFRLSDGSLVLHGADCCSLFRSVDEGLTWTRIETPGSTNKVFVNDKDEIFVNAQPFTLYKSTDYGATFKYVYAASPEWGSSIDNIFYKVNNFYYILAPGWGILKSADLTHYEIYWINSNLRDLFIDHNGVLLAKYWNWEAPYQNTVYYRKNSE